MKTKPGGVAVITVRWSEDLGEIPFLRVDNVPLHHEPLTFDAASNVYAAFPAKLYSAAAACSPQAALNGSS